MPNHCENDLYLQGDKADIDAVLLHVGMYKPKAEFDFNTVIPYPDPFRAMDDDVEQMRLGVGDFPHPNDPEREAKLAEINRQREAYKAKWGTTSDGYNSGGYEWCCANWATKWNAYDIARRDYDGHVCITFQTAWAPPVPVIVALAKLFPKVTFTLEYFERGMAFAGGFQCPSEDDWYEDRQWEHGIVINEWEVKGYRGIRGG